MALATTQFDSLPYIDKDPTPEERAAAEALIAAEQVTVEARPLPDGYIPHFTPAMSALLDACEARAPDATGPIISAIDLSRYEDPSATDAEILAGAKRVLLASSASPSPSPQEATEAADAAAAASPLHRLCAAHAYLVARRENLGLMQEHGNQAWLQANHHLEGEVKALEAEAEAERRVVDELAEARRRAQDAVAGEAASLADSWRRGVERMVGVQVAVEVARAQVRERMRAAVQ